MGSHLTYQPPYEDAIRVTAKALAHIGSEGKRWPSKHRNDNFEKLAQYKPRALRIPNYDLFVADANAALDRTLDCCRRSEQSMKFSATLCDFIKTRTSNHMFARMFYYWDTLDSLVRSVPHDLQTASPILDDLMQEYTKSKMLKLMLVI